MMAVCLAVRSVATRGGQRADHLALHWVGRSVVERAAHLVLKKVESMAARLVQHSVEC